LALRGCVEAAAFVAALSVLGGAATAIAPAADAARAGRQVASVVPAEGGWQLTWSDEFEGPAGVPDPQRWVFDVGGHGWGNDELQYHTTVNASLTGDGQLAIRARRESFTGPDGVTRAFTSARLKTQDRFEQSYGRFEGRIKVPRGQGLWPAFWLLGVDIRAVGWPQCGEIDIMENIGREPRSVHGTLHGPGYSGDQGLGGSFTLSGNASFADDFHVFALEWEPGGVRWYVDGELFHSRSPAGLPRGGRWVFNHPFFLILSVAVGGRWPGSPDAATEFPQTMLVDYVRVYRKVD